MIPKLKAEELQKATTEQQKLDIIAQNKVFAHIKQSVRCC